MTPPTDTAAPAPSERPAPDVRLPEHLGADRFLIHDGQCVVLVGVDAKRLMIRVLKGQTRGTHHGEIDLDNLIGLPIGSVVYTRKGIPFHTLRPTLEDFVMAVKRATQIVYPKDMAPILLRLGLFPGATVAECGSGSGAMTTALAWMVAPGGKVYSYDRKDEHQAKARKNIEKVGLTDAVDFRQRDVELDGFDVGPVDAVFLDLKDVAAAVPHAARALHPGCCLAALVPTMNQVSEVIKALSDGQFADIEVLETFHRKYKINPARMRPYDRMIAHTGYVIFARRVTPLPADAPTGVLPRRRGDDDEDEAEGGDEGEPDA